MQELEDVCGVQLAFVENQFGPGAAVQVARRSVAARGACVPREPTAFPPNIEAESVELKAEAARLAEELAGLGEVDPQYGKAALAVFDWSQRAAETWLVSNSADRRQILDTVFVNRQVTDVTLVTTKRKPFDFLAERLDLKNSRGGGI